jgi:hypothetical protein
MQLAEHGDGTNNIAMEPGTPAEIPNDQRPATINDVDLPPVSEDWDDYAVERQPAPVQPAPVQQPPAAPVVQATPQPVAATPPVQPGQPPQPGAAAQPTAPAARPDQAFEQIAAELSTAMPAIEQALAERDYAISDADWTKYEGMEPRQVYSILQGQVHARAVSSMMRVMAQQLPVVVNGLVRAHVANQNAVDRFWKTYPQLDRRQHGPVVRQMAQTMRAMNPQMDEVNLAKLTAFNAMLQLGISPSVAPAQPNSNGAGAPVRINQPGRQVRQVTAPYTPAGVGTAPASPAPRQRSQWDMTAALIEADDAGQFDSLL